MTGPSDSLDDLKGDIRNLSTLLRSRYDVAADKPMPEDEGIAKAMQQVSRSALDSSRPFRPIDRIFSGVPPQRSE